MSDPREELARPIHLKTPFGIDAQSLADAIIAAGYSKRTPGGDAGRMAFEAYSNLTTHIERMASTGVTGSMADWSNFLGALNAALSTRPAGESAGVVAVALTKLVEDFEADASKARHEYSLSGKLDGWQSGLAAAYSSSAARLRCALGIEALAARASQPSATRT